MTVSTPQAAWDLTLALPYRWKIAGALVAGSLCAVAILVAALYWATSHVPAFYEQALRAEAESQLRGNDEMLACATALANSSRHVGPWYANVTADQINGWLAVDLVRNHSELLPPEMVDPRVYLEPGRATIACGFRYPGWSTVVSASLDIYLAEPQTIALRIHSARAGVVPVPIAPLVDGITRIAERFNLRLEWRQSHGDPVALITLPAAHTKSTLYRLEALQLRDGNIQLVGRTEALPGTESPSPSSEESQDDKPQTDLADRSDANRKVQ